MQQMLQDFQSVSDHFTILRSKGLNILKFELHYEWTPSPVFFCGHQVLQLFSHNLEEAHDIKCS